jgi:hypothetical protein
MPGVVQRLHGRAAHRARGPDQAVQAGVVDHPDDRRDTAPLLTDQPGSDSAELDLRGWERTSTELVLQALELHSLAALDEEAREPRRRLREHEEGVTGRVGAEPFVSVELVPAFADRIRARDVGTHV